jgi:hypothetical protein
MEVGNLVDKHKVFVAFHSADVEYKDKFEKICKDVIVTRSVQDGDIPDGIATETTMQKIRDDYLSDSTVTVVLIGKNTWQRKYVDWEIYSSLRETKNSFRSGLLGILLPTYPRSEPGKYTHNTIPPRLYDNTNRGDSTKIGYANIYEWIEDPQTIKKIVDEAFSKRDTVPVDISRDRFEKNRLGEQWSN